MRARPARPRLPSWPERLAALVEARRAMPFAWGSHDCCLYAADAIEAVTGADPAADFRGRYASEAEAAALLGELGLEGTVAAQLAAFGAPECPVRWAQRGDCVLVAAGNQPMLGVMIGSRISVPGTERMQFFPLAAGVRAWAI